MNPWFRGLPGSRAIQVHGRERRYPTLQDYEQHLRATAVLDAGVALADRPDLVVEVQADWHRKGQNGCLFAGALAANREECGWELVPLLGSAGWTDADWLREVHERTLAGIDDPERWIVSFLFPDVRDLSGVRRLLTALGRLPGWSFAELSPDEHRKKQAAPGWRYYKLRIRVKSGHNIPAELLDAEEGKVVDVDAWPLFFADLDFLPLTRRAPFTELAIPLKPKRSKNPPELSNDWEASHLADVPAPVPVTESFKAMLDNTSALKRGILGDAGYASLGASARTTLAVPQELWEAAAVPVGA